MSRSVRAPVVAFSERTLTWELASRLEEVYGRQVLLAGNREGAAGAENLAVAAERVPLAPCEGAAAGVITGEPEDPEHVGVICGVDADSVVLTCERGHSTCDVANGATDGGAAQLDELEGEHIAFSGGDLRHPKLALGVDGHCAYGPVNALRVGGHGHHGCELRRAGEGSELLLRAVELADAGVHGAPEMMA